jgi:hypothetical protein
VHLHYSYCGRSACKRWQLLHVSNYCIEALLYTQQGQRNAASKPFSLSVSNATYHALLVMTTALQHLLVAILGFERI